MKEQKINKIVERLYRNGHIGLGSLRAIKEALSEAYDKGEQKIVDDLYKIQQKAIGGVVNTLVEKSEKE